MPGLIIGVDIGGSKILSGIISPGGQILARKKEATPAGHSAGHIVDQICKTVMDLRRETGAKREDIQGMAVGAPGPLDYESGIIKDPPNINWREFPLRDELNKRLDVQLLLDNDANMAALGELYFGSSKPCRHLIYMTVSTGIGGGIIQGGKVYRGKDGAAGEFGRMIMAPAGGDLESLASGTAMADTAEKLIQQGRGHGIMAFCSEGNPVTAREIGAAARQGDPEALQIINHAGEFLGIAVANLVNIFNPERVVLGGGAGLGLQDLLLPPVQYAVHTWVAPSLGKNLQVEFTALGEDIGLLGCAAAVLYEGMEN